MRGGLYGGGHGSKILFHPKCYAHISLSVACNFRLNNYDLDKCSCQE